jgi:hypothetical protein
MEVQGYMEGSRLRSTEITKMVKRDRVCESARHKSEDDDEAEEVEGCIEEAKSQGKEVGNNMSR